MRIFPAWTALLAVSMVGPIAAAAPDKVEQALSEVRQVKADLYSRESSVLGTLPGPEEMAAHQLRCRPTPSPRCPARSARTPGGSG